MSMKTILFLFSRVKASCDCGFKHSTLCMDVVNPELTNIYMLMNKYLHQCYKIAMYGRWIEESG